jgi:hypothetical protein
MSPRDMRRHMIHTIFRRLVARAVAVVVTPGIWQQALRSV